MPAKDLRLPTQHYIDGRAESGSGAIFAFLEGVAGAAGMVLVQAVVTDWFHGWPSPSGPWERRSTPTHVTVGTLALTPVTTGPCRRVAPRFLPVPRICG